MGNQVDSARFMAGNAKDSVVNRVDYGIYRVFSIFGEASDSLENIIFRNFNEDQFTQLKEIFTQLDTNKDGSLSREEFRSFFSKAQGLAASSEEYENMFDDIDLNKDGKISKEEFDQFIDYISSNSKKC